MSESGSAPACPLPLAAYPRVVMAHGGGGRLMHDLIESILRPALDNAALGMRHDGALLRGLAGEGNAALAFTTDSYVVSPLVFPGGDIGRLAVYGTVNDLAMCGARPRHLGLGLILEEGLEIATLQRITASIADAAARCGVQVVTGDTKVVERGHGDGLYVNTSGVGVCEHPLTIAPASIRPGDAVLLSGDIGRHGIAIMAAREGLEFETRIESDCAALAEPVLALLDAGVEVHCLRDLTRGGLGAALVELAEAARVGITVHEPSIPVDEEVGAACEILGLEPLFVANEGRFVAVLPERDAEAGLAVLRRFAVSAGAVRIGAVTGAGDGVVGMEGLFGVERVVDLPSGEQLPRIC